MQDFCLYFDESNKLDERKVYSYYGAYGGTANVINELNKEIELIFDTLKTESELHFSQYNHDKHLKKYFLALSTVLNNPNPKFRIFIVNNKDALQLAKDLNINIFELRNLFYIKIPERLFYGMLRDFQESSRINIFVDESSEYDKLDLFTKLRDQVNAHSAYRKKNYIVKEVQSTNSEDCLNVQIADVLMGIVVFLMEKSYRNHSNTSTIKSDLIYRLLMAGNNLLNFQQKIIIYRWDENTPNPTKIPLSEYVSEFVMYKAVYDSNEIYKLQKLLLENPGLSTKDCRLEMGYPNTQLQMLFGYKNEIEGKGRNYSLITNSLTSTSAPSGPISPDVK